jgi:hypothetical protein
LAEDFPGLVNLMGLETFEAWMERYLTHYPSHHFTLYYLGEDLFDFMQKHYDQANKPLILDCVRYEWAKAHAYFDAEALPFSPENLTDDQKANLAALPLRLQPHVYPLALQYDLSTWAQNNYKKKPKVKQTYVVVYRYDYKLTDQLISRAFYQLIFTLKSELHTLDSALDTVMSHLNTKDHRHLEANLQQWFSLCVQKRWICHPEK